MGKLRSLVGGAILGAGGMYVGLQYHVLLAPEGFLMVPRAPQHSLKDSYADIQGWDAQAWAGHPQIARAVTAYKRADLIGEGVRNNLFEGLRETALPSEEQMSKTSSAWEPATAPVAPDPIPEGKVAGAGGSSKAEGGPKRSFLPLAELFGFKASTEQPAEAPSEGIGADQSNLVLPTGTSSPPEVEFLPSPDEVDLGQPQPLPRRPGWRQSDVEDSQRTADNHAVWEPLSAHPSGLDAS